MSEQKKGEKILYIHIGTPKTGTTAIQAFCQENRKVLKKKGYCYPTFPYEYTDAISRRNGHFLVGAASCMKKKNADSKENLDIQSEQQNFRGGMDQIRDLFKRFDNVILSDEGIWTATGVRRASLWQELKEEADKNNFQIKIIVYLRRQAEYLNSSWNQSVKVGNIKECVYTWEQYRQNIPDLKQEDYAAKLDSIAAALGKENIIVRRYDWSSFVEGSIYADFLQVVGLNLTEEYSIARPNRNGGLSGNTHEIKRVLNTLHMNRYQNTFFKEVLLGFAEVSNEEYPSSTLSKEDILEIIDEHKAGNERIAKEYLHEEDGKLFSDDVKDVTKWEKDNPHMIDDLIRFVGMSNIFLLEEIEQLKKEQEELKKELQAHKKFKNVIMHPIRTLVRKVVR